MYGFPRPQIPNNLQWNRPRCPNNPQWRPFHGPCSPRAPRAQFRPRNQGYNNYRPQIQAGGEEHWCETCDRGFPTEDLLIKHKQEHQKCNIDGCQFIAHPKVITKHIQMQHSSGLYKKIAKLNNPEEIEKWREERRKKYPTKINIDKKEAEIKEKIERGEKMGLGRKEWRDKGGNRDNRDFRAGQGMKRGHSNDNQPGTKLRKPNRRPKKPDIIPKAEDQRKLAPFTGIQFLVMDEDEEADEILNGDDLIDDDDVGMIEAKPEAVEKAIVCGALSSLMCEYGSSDEEINELENTKCKNKIGRSQVEQHSKTTSKNDKRTPEITNTIESSKCKVKITDNLPVVPKNENTNQNRRNPNQASVSSVNKQDLNEIDDGNESGPEEAKVVKNEEPVAIEKENNDGVKNKILKKKVEMRKKPVYRKPKPKLPSTLIYRLLSNEMKHERNVVLQCIRHIRKNNYFVNST